MIDQKLMDDIFLWAEKTFPNQTVRAKLCHLREELDEFLEDYTGGADTEKISEELADCWILMLNATKLAGYDVPDIRKAIERKMEINRNRQWSAPDMNGVCHHIK